MVLVLTSQLSPVHSGARCTVPPEVKEWFCSLARVMPDWTMTQCFRFRKKGFSHPSSSTCTSDTPRKWFSHKTPGTALGRPALPGTRSCPGPGRHRVPCLQQSVLWRRSAGRTPECAPGDTWWPSVPLLRTPYTPIHAITWVLLQETQGRAREGVARSNDTDASRTVPAEDRVDIARCWHHRSQPHHQH